jgi:hypothetical protein
MSPPTQAALFIRGDKGNFASLVPNLGCKSIDILLRLDQNFVVVLTLDHDGRPLELAGFSNSINPIRNHYPQAQRAIRSASDSHWRNLRINKCWVGAISPGAGLAGTISKRGFGMTLLWVQGCLLGLKLRNQAVCGFLYLPVSNLLFEPSIAGNCLIDLDALTAHESRPAFARVCSLSRFTFRSAILFQASGQARPRIDTSEPK